MKIPYLPVKTEVGSNGESVLVYRLEDVNNFGEPFLYGIDKYLVLASFEDLSPPTTDWQFEYDRRGARPRHRYSRFARFRALLRTFMGSKIVPGEVIRILKECDDFEEARRRLKTAGFAKFYNSIPSLMLGNLEIDRVTVERIETDFMAMSHNFDHFYDGKRKYFPNMRFVCLNLMELNCVYFDKPMEKIRTRRKRKPLEELFDLLY